MPDNTILLTGAGGQVGGQLLPVLARLGSVLVPRRDELDLVDPDGMRRYVRKTRPRWIVNAAAYTAVDRAESEPELAFAVNAAAVGALGEAAAELAVPVLHFSTDYVFDGSGTRPRREDDETAPLGVYGASKREGERLLAASGAAHLIFRTSWVFGATGNNFLRTVLRLARECEELRVVADQHGAPTWSHDLAELVVHTIMRCEKLAKQQGTTLAEAMQPLSGIYHACSAGETTWFGFAKEFLRLAAIAEPGQRLAQLVPITSAEYPTPAARPANSRLDCTKLTRELGFTMPEWKQSTAAVTAELLGQGYLAMGAGM
jgi:dTDP-4-dehydrorhamnose reductase